MRKLFGVSYTFLNVDTSENGQRQGEAKNYKAEARPNAASGIDDKANNKGTDKATGFIGD